MTHLDLDRLLVLAANAAAEAGAALLAERAAWRTVEAEEGREVKVRADRQAEALIVAALSAGTAFPILSEEAGWIGASGADVVWSVDPLDGSVNYVQGFPHWAVSIALAVEGRPVLGVVAAPALGETLTGIVGRGAWRDGAAVRVSEVSDPQRGVLMTGIPARAATDPAAMQALTERLLSYRKIRMIGSAACALACVATGRAEAYHETGGMFWDVAGGCALVEAAGGRVTISGARLDAPLEVRADNGRVAPAA